jgi:hypothetical protein
MQDDNSNPLLPHSRMTGAFWRIHNEDMQRRQ